MMLLIKKRNTTKLKQSSIEDHIKKETKTIVDDIVAEFFYPNEISFNVVRNTLFEVLN